MGRHDISAEARLKILEALQLGNRIEAIRLYREATGCDLAEATWFVDELAREGPLSGAALMETSGDGGGASGTGCLGALCVVVAFGVLIALST